ncbi:hypothetical protein BCONGLO52_12610 [Brachybacterium conglomeratum]|uniref:Uncharacterized protein n=1 Tax=Brachybacterium conglomeratum TaxID=47846 RepID=A0ABQ5RF15_9MICO|nr:hypothetical protein BCONGLO52_12610 [Brachybacterium conglomeratum]GLK04959.1 hypothetical protein GCM10017597_17590 [Brachybacterium conglomeratum]
MIVRTGAPCLRAARRRERFNLANARPRADPASIMTLGSPPPLRSLRELLARILTHGPRHSETMTP